VSEADTPREPVEGPGARAHRRGHAAPGPRVSWPIVALVATIVLGLMATLVVVISRHASDGGGSSAATSSTTPSATPTTSSPSPSPSESATPSPSPTPTAYPLGTFTVATTDHTFVDPTRGTMARGSRAATSNRTLPTSVRYPGNPDGRGPFPVVVFAEGFNISVRDYAPLLDDLASRGYVVVAPEFPMATTIYDGNPSQADLDNEPGDVRFVLTSVMDTAAAGGPLQGLIDPDRVAIMGHSDGAYVAAVIGYDPTFRDRRFTAAVILSGQAGDIHSSPGLDGSPPLLVAHGTADEINPYWIGPAIQAAVSPPHYLLTIAGARHLAPFTDAPIRPAVSEVIAAFLDLHLRGIAGAAETLTAAGNAPGLTLTP
jgi:dienelactone hydrolase